tara:strand:+ start:706 stop:1119 length:414 start_codon:yes stop_codon:yes gene_type:complete
VQTPPNNDTIADALDITPVNEVKKLPVETSVPSNTEKDLDYARENYYHLIETGRRSLEDLVDVANQSQHPRAYEVIATLIKTLTDTNDKVVDLQSKAKAILSDTEAKKVTNNNLFVGSTTELTRILGGNARDVLKNK